VISDDEWVRDTFIPTIQQRGAAVIKARKLGSAASAANAVTEHVRDWLLGTQHGEYVSMAVYSDGKSYGIAEGVVYSFPVSCANGEWKIVHGLSIDKTSRELMEKTYNELVEEAAIAMQILKD
jgi:malate dehydrogenase